MDGPVPFENPLNVFETPIQLLKSTFKLTGSMNKYANNSGMVGVTVGVTVFVGVIVLLGVIVGVAVLLGVTGMVGVTVGVTEMVGVTVGVIEMVGVTIGVVVFVGVIDLVGVGVTQSNSTVTPAKNCSLVILSYIGMLSMVST